MMIYDCDDQHCMAKMCFKIWQEARIRNLCCNSSRDSPFQRCVVVLRTARADTRSRIANSDWDRVSFTHSIDEKEEE